MAYITTSNANNIIFKTDLKSIDLKGEIYKSPLYFFNKLEMKRLLAVKELFRDSEYFLANYYKPIDTKDSFNFVFEGKPPAYHKTSKCYRLNSDFENFEIPDSIKEQGKSVVIEFRSWFKENKNLMSDPDLFVSRLNSRWKIVTNPKNINRENSGISKFEDYRPIDLEKKIDALIKKAGLLYFANKSILSEFSKFSFLGTTASPLNNNNTGFSDSKVKLVLREFENEVKKPLTPLLIDYFRVTLNPDLNLHENVLVQLGFRKCNSCFRETEIPKFRNFSSIMMKYFPVFTIPENIRETFNLVKKGYSIAQIAKSRELTVGTIIKHLIKINEIIGNKELTAIKPNERIIIKVRHAVNNIGGRDKLRLIYDALEQKITYDEIRLSLLFIDE